jgi:hypothetical protein
MWDHLFETRPGFKKMMEKLLSNGVKTIIVETANRLMHTSRPASYVSGSLTPMLECYRCDITVSIPQTASDEAFIKAALHSG